MLTPDEQEVLKIGIDAALKPLTDRIEDVTRPIAKTIGQMLNAMFCDQMQNVVRIYGRAGKMLDKVGITITPVRLKLLKPILDGASMEDDEFLQEHWAALLANASDPSQGADLPIIYPDILRQLSVNDAKFLHELLFHTIPTNTLFPDDPPNERHERKAILEHNLGTTQNLAVHFATATGTTVEEIIKNGDAFDVSLGNSLRLNLLRVSRETRAVPERLRPHEITEPAVDYYYFTGLGIQFLRACQPPKEKQKPS